MVQHIGIIGKSDLTVLKFIIEETENTRHCQICLFKVWCIYFKNFRGKKKSEISWPKSLKDKMAQQTLKTLKREF